MSLFSDERLLKNLDLLHLKDVPEFATNDLRMANREKINAVVQEEIGKHPRDYWIEHLNRAGVPCGPIHDLSDVFHDPQVLHQEMLLEVEQPEYGVIKMTGFPVKLRATPCKLRHPAPRLGEHSKAILNDLGFSEHDVENLATKRVI